MDLVTYTLARGASSQQALYVEDVFSAQLYTGSAGFSEINNGVNLSDYGGLVWTKNINNSTSHVLVTDVNGLGNYLSADTSGALSSVVATGGTFTFTKSGYTISSNTGSGSGTKASGASYSSWTFRKAKKFFDIVTYTGNGTSQVVPHGLNATPGFIMVKRTNATGSWICWHQDAVIGLPTGYFLIDNISGITTNTSFTGFPWNATFPTTTGFSVGSLGAGSTPSGHLTNISGAQYVAYIFANGTEGGFGDDGTENIIKCGTYTVTGANQSIVDMGFEPGFIFTKAISRTGGTLTGDTVVVDNVRNFNTLDTNGVKANSAFVSVDLRNTFPTPSGFIGNAPGYSLLTYSGTTYVYFAIIKGLMRPPTSSSGVYAQRLQAPNTTAQFVNFGIKVDCLFSIQRNGPYSTVFSRLLGAAGSYSFPYIISPPSGNSFLSSGVLSFASNSGLDFGTDAAGLPYEGALVQRNYQFVHYAFSNAASFFNNGVIVKASGSGANLATIKHSLRVPPELIIIGNFTSANTASGWLVYSFLNNNNQFLRLNTASGLTTSTGIWTSTPTKTSFQMDLSRLGGSSGTSEYVVFHAFASCPGVSKIGSYTGTTNNIDVNCGFVNGAKFIMIKRVDANTSGDWYVWDSVRGIVPSSDPYSRWNISTGATVTGEVSNTDFIDSYSPGFTVTNTATGTVNISGAVYLFMAIA